MNRTAATSARTQRLAAKLLRVLRQGDATASELAAALRVSISETPALADHLTSLGFDISRNPLLGYHLVSEPSQLCTEAILSYVEGEWLPNIVTVQSTGSTNTDAIRRGLYEDPGPFILFAEHQTDGRGRLGRSWESPPGEGLWMSFFTQAEMFSVHLPPHHFPGRSGVVGVSRFADRGLLSNQVAQRRGCQRP